MSGLIEEIQRDASSDAASVSQLLRRMKIAASKLQLGGLEAWVEHELSGYPDERNLPDYRVIGGVPMCHHVMHGWRMMALGPSDSVNAAFQINLFSGPISEIESRADTKGQLIMSYPDFLERPVVQSMHGVDKVGLSVDGGKFRAALDAVRNRCLEWALKMEEAGITGEGLSFTHQEKAAAQQVTYNINGNNSRLNIGSTDNSSNQVVTASVFDDLRACLSKEVQDEGARSPLLEAVSVMEQTKGTNAFAKAYATFVGLAADHIQVLQWALPILATYINLQK